MSNAISPQRSSSPYSQRISPQRNADHAQRSEESAATQDASQETPGAASSAGPDQMAELSAQEKQMIRKEFPDKPDLSMHLYGSDRQTENVSPDAVGQRLDMQA